MKKTLQLVVTLILVILFVSPQVYGKTSKEFTDLESTHWAYESIQEMVSLGILEGYPDNTFRPDAKVSRAAFAKIMVLTLNLEMKETNEAGFTDVPADYWAMDYINTADKYLTGYKNIYNNTYSYKPNDNTVREDVAVAIVRALNITPVEDEYSVLANYTDSNEISENLKPYVEEAIKRDLMVGNNNEFNAQGELSRAEACVLLLRIKNSDKKTVLVEDEIVSNRLINSDGLVTYEGDIVEGLAEGRGTEYFQNGKIKYIGEFSKGLYEGKGVSYSADGEIIYDGEFVDGLYEGQGVLNDEDLSVYEGEFLNGLKHGEGKIIYSVAESYTGEFAFDKKNGQGTYIYSPTMSYVGQWSDDMFNGTGSYYFPDGDVYTGNWENNVMTGEGKYLFSNGEYYEGEFLNNSMYGVGKYYYSDDYIQQGNWMYNTFMD